MSPIKKEIGNLKIQEERYTKAYGAGLLDVGQLKEYVTPLKGKIAVLQAQVAKNEAESNYCDEIIAPSAEEIISYAKEATMALKRLSFIQKREIVLSTVGRVVGTQEKLLVTGYLPIPSTQNVGYKTISRNRRPAKRRQINPFQRSY